MRNRLATALLSILALLPLPALAQVNAQWLRAASGLAKGLEFPGEPTGLPISGTPRMAIYKPDGPGPYPAIVLMHQCGGMSAGNSPNVSMFTWAKEAVAHGYVAFVVDSLRSRGVDTLCLGARGGVNPVRGVKDALQAAEHLRRFDFVDKKRIAVAGYSWGAMVAAGASSRLWGSTLSPGERFAAGVSFYPGCEDLRPPNSPSYNLVNDDIDRPLLVLMGSKDNLTPPEECVPRLEKAKAAGAPVEWHVYQGATHCWDCENMHGFSKVDARGNRVVYYYDKETTRDSARRMFEFLGKALSAR